MSCTFIRIKGTWARGLFRIWNEDLKQKWLGTFDLDDLRNMLNVLSAGGSTTASENIYVEHQISFYNRTKNTWAFVLVWKIQYINVRG